MQQDPVFWYDLGAQFRCCHTHWNRMANPCTMGNKIFTFKAPVVSGVETPGILNQVEKLMKFHHFVEQLPILRLSPVVQPSVFLQECSGQAHGHEKFTLCWTRDSNALIIWLWQFLMLFSSIFFITCRRAGASHLHSPPFASKKACCWCGAFSLVNIDILKFVSCVPEPCCLYCFCISPKIILSLWLGLTAWEVPKGSNQHR